MMNNKFCYENHDWEKIKNSALQTLKQSSLKDFPVSLDTLLTENNIKLRKYSAIARQTNMSIKEVGDYLTTDDGILLSKKDSKCRDVIAYNDTISNESRIRFSLSHELGHKKLNHNSHAKTLLSQLPSDEYSYLEQEANFFAKNLLAPFPCLSYIEEQIEQPLSANEVQIVFGLSNMASEFVLENYQKLSYKITDSKLITQFQDSLDWWSSILNMTHRFSIAT